MDEGYYEDNLGQLDQIVAFEHLSCSCEPDYKFIVENLTFDTYFMNALRSWRALRCLILFTTESAKVAKISLKCLVFNYNYAI